MAMTTTGTVNEMIMSSVFTLTTPLSRRFGPRLGQLLSKRSGTPDQVIETPSFVTSTSRGVVPHLSRDHHRATKAIRWANVPFETFLEHNPPVPTLLTGANPMHNFLGFVPGQHLLSLCIRDPADGREMPPNGNKHTSAYCLRGVRKVSPENWRTYVEACQPDMVVAMYDQPFTDPPYSQKRLTKSIERTSAWLADLLLSLQSSQSSRHRPLVLVQMAGGTNIAARKAFSTNLTDILYGKEADAIAPLTCLDEGVFGYTFDLVPLRQSLDPTTPDSPTPTADPTLPDPVPSDVSTQSCVQTTQLIPFIQASLSSLPTTKIRVTHTARSPHEILRLIQDVGIDIFDAHWAQKAADVGVALDFQFPVPKHGATTRRNGKRDLGHNLYHSQYTHDLCWMASSFSKERPCTCLACSPFSPATRIEHSIVDHDSQDPIASNTQKPSFSRAYIHHLLHTHEMSAHSLLTMHNLTILDEFFSGIRSVLSTAEGKSFFVEVDRFVDEYDETLEVFDEARLLWREVDLARGKGRLAREKSKQTQSTLGTAIQG
ncbi:hypothetical protein BDN72DRAFT_842823 [Pluteus cervinus]|uniref:Uncharacterized protein n=1 Tax=Pluteus cervinus TaxID=181527 RepID=A0ACD3AQP9_9AGAR|nr:hypothetical protein BDN72DRAFT_842823 [Pluteus cervinus]